MLKLAGSFLVIAVSLLYGWKVKEELKAHGLNDSITHVDFMVGTADLNITGKTRDGQEVPIFINGNFAF